jgi:uncharacterized protein (DUF1015 family)
MNISPIKALFADLSMVPSPDSFYATVKEEFHDYKKSNFFNKIEDESFFVYEIKTPERVHTGIMCCVDIGDYEDGKILKHENTLAEKEQKMMNLFLQRKAMIKPVLLTHPPVEELHDLMYAIKKDKKPFFKVGFVDNTEVHKIWAISDKHEIQRIETIFKEKIPTCYIADGHHRCSTTLYLSKGLKGKKKKAIKSNQLFSVFFDFSELVIFDYNRIVEAFTDISPLEFMARISAVFDVEVITEASKPQKQHELTMNIGREWFRLHWKTEILEKHKSSGNPIDAQMLDSEVFQNILGMEDIRTDSRISYVEGVKTLDFFHHRVIKKPDNVGFLLYPVELEEVCSIADEGKVMPPKSTWFEPRIKNGMLVYEL